MPEETKEQLERKLQAIEDNKQNKEATIAFARELFDIQFNAEREMARLIYNTACVIADSISPPPVLAGDMLAACRAVGIDREAVFDMLGDQREILSDL